MRILYKVLLAILITGLSVSAQTVRAQQDRIWQNEKPWFVSAQIGETNYDATLQGDGPWWGNVDDNSAAYTLGVGYNALPQFGLRLTYEWARDIEAVNQCPPGQICPAIIITEPTDTDTASLAAMPRWNFAPGWTLFGTAGVMGWRIKPDDVIDRDRGLEVLAGMGLGYEFPGGIALAVEYQETVLSPDLNYDALSLNLIYNFEF